MSVIKFVKTFLTNIFSKRLSLSLISITLTVISPSPGRAAGEHLLAQESTKRKNAKKTKKTKDRTTTETSVESSSESITPAGDSSPSNTSTKSEDIRRNQRYEANAMYTPVSDFILQYGASFGKALSPKLRLGLTYLGGSKNMDVREGTTIATSQLSGIAIYGHGRYFVGNSFNVLSGLGYRAANINYRVSDALFSVEGKITIHSITIPVFIGNAWTWNSGFTLGVDWIGAFVPISGSAKSTLNGNLPSGVASDLNDTFVELGTKLAKTTSLTMFLTSIGWAF